jgi:hypothetical protein
VSDAEVELVPNPRERFARHVLSLVYQRVVDIPEHPCSTVARAAVEPPAFSLPPRSEEPSVQITLPTLADLEFFITEYDLWPPTPPSDSNQAGEIYNPHRAAWSSFVADRQFILNSFAAHNQTGDPVVALHRKFQSLTWSDELASKFITSYVYALQQELLLLRDWGSDRTVPTLEPLILPLLHQSHFTLPTLAELKRFVQQHNLWPVNPGVSPSPDLEKFHNLRPTLLDLATRPLTDSANILLPLPDLLPLQGSFTSSEFAEQTSAYLWSLRVAWFQEQYLGNLNFSELAVGALLGK